MTFCFTNRIEIEETNAKHLENLTRILNIEYNKPDLHERSRTKIIKEKNKVIIEIKAKDIVALRSSINGAIKILYTFKKISNLIR